MQTLLLTVFTQTVFQDIFLRPSRLSVDTLRQQYCLPSTLSQFESVSVPSSNGTDTPLGVHFLKYPNNNTMIAPHRFDALYVNHGFGASSLSWLPALPALVQRLGAKVGLGHDAVGFGFTKRPDELEWYTSNGSARIGQQVLLQHTGSSSPASVALFGHSLGSLTTLKMALQLPKETAKFILLSAPALGIRSTSSKRAAPPPPSTKNTKKQQQLGQRTTPSFLRRVALDPVGSLLREGVLYPVGGYILRRAVGANNSWRTGLQAVWGDPKRLRDSDVLRFQWPSIGAGWERGLLQFARAAQNYKEDDKALLRNVLELPNTTVVIVLGSKDKVIPSNTIRKFLLDFPQIPVVELEGLGHDAFEEDVDTFLGAVEELLQSSD